MNIFVGNLSRQVTDEQLRQVFEPYGAVSSASVVRGFGFVEMPNQQEALAAIQGVNGLDLEGKAVDVTQARTRDDRSGSYYRSNGYNNNRSGGGYSSNRSGGGYNSNRTGGGNGRSGPGAPKRDKRRAR